MLQTMWCHQSDKRLWKLRALVAGCENGSRENRIMSVTFWSFEGEEAVLQEEIIRITFSKALKSFLKMGFRLHWTQTPKLLGEICHLWDEIFKSASLSFPHQIPLSLACVFWNRWFNQVPKRGCLMEPLTEFLVELLQDTNTLFHT